MKKLWVLVFAVAMVSGMVQAAWYWPFGSDENTEPRLSELMESASELIDNASDAADEGKIDEALDNYRKALEELDRVERENPERAQRSEFATVRNKRAYVNAAIDSLLLQEARRNSAQVAITDTSELEKTFERIQKERQASRNAVRRSSSGDDAHEVNEALKDLETANKAQGARETAENANPSPRREKLREAVEMLRTKDFEGAEVIIRTLLEEKPNDAAALNLRASVEMASGRLRLAEKTLDQCIQSNPKSYYAYYNMAKLLLQTRKKNAKEVASEYYNSGREIGGPRDEKLEAMLGGE